MFTFFTVHSINSDHISSRRCQTQCEKLKENSSKTRSYKDRSFTSKWNLRWVTEANYSTKSTPTAIQNAVLRSTHDPTNSLNAAPRSTHDLRWTDRDYLGIDTRSHTKPEKLWYHLLCPSKEFTDKEQQHLSPDINALNAESISNNMTWTKIQKRVRSKQLNDVPQLAYIFRAEGRISYINQLSYKG